MIRAKLLTTLLLGLGWVALLAPTRTVTQIETTLRGKVSDVTGAGVSRAAILLLSEQRVLRATSSEAGEFAIAVPPGNYELYVQRPGFVVFRKEVKVEEGDAQTVAIRLNVLTTGCDEPPGNAVYEDEKEPKIAIAGLVREYGGSVSLPAHVLLTRANSSEIVQAARASERGEFAFHGLAPGKYVVRAWHPGYYDFRSQAFWVTRQTVTHFSVEIRKEGSLILCE